MTASMTSFYHWKILLRKFFSLTERNETLINASYFSKNNESQLEAGDFLIKNSIKIAPLRNFWPLRLTVN